MKRAKFNVEGLTNVTEDLYKVINSIDEVIDNYNKENILNVKVFNSSFDIFLELIGKYMGKCLVTISEPYNDGLFGVSIEKSVDMGCLPEVNSEFYKELKELNSNRGAKSDDYYYKAYRFYINNSNDIKVLYHHMVNYTNNFIKC